MLLGFGFLVLLTIAVLTIRLLFPQTPPSMVSQKEVVGSASNRSSS